MPEFRHRLQQMLAFEERRGPVCLDLLPWKQADLCPGPSFQLPGEYISRLSTAVLLFEVPTTLLAMHDVTTSLKTSICYNGRCLAQEAQRASTMHRL